MKVTLRRNYSYDQVVVEPTEHAWNPEFVVELPINEVTKILELQAKFEELQQQLVPVFKASEELQRARAEAKKAAEEAEKNLEEAEVTN